MTGQITLFDSGGEQQITYIPRAHIRMPERFDSRLLLDEDSIRQLAEDIRTNGMYHPIHVQAAHSSGDAGALYEIIAGKRRFLAGEIADVDPVPCIIHREISDAQAEILAVNENWLREPPCEVDVARTVGLLRERRLNRGEPATNQAIGRLFNRVGPWVSERITIYDNLIKSGILDRVNIEPHLLRQLTKETLKKAADQPAERNRIRVLLVATGKLQPQPKGAPGKRTRTKRKHPKFKIQAHTRTGGISIRIDYAQMGKDEKAAARRQLLPHLRSLGFEIDADYPDKLRQDRQ